MLVHYTRGPPTRMSNHLYRGMMLNSSHTACLNNIEIVPSLLSAPVRQYPLRPITEPSVYIMGEKAGQKVYPSGSAPPPPPQAPMGMPPQPMGMNQQGMNPQVIGLNQQTMGMNPQAMIAQQNSTMEALERRRERERARERGSSMSGVRFSSYFL